MKVFACVNHSPDEVARFVCDSLNINPASLNFVGDSVNKKRVQMFLDYKTFQRLHRTLPKKSDDMIVVVFGHPIQFCSWNMIPLDYRESEDPHLNAFEYLPLDRKVLRVEGKPLVYKREGYLDKIVKTVAAFDSLLHGLMSFIYTMKTPEQKLAKESACRFLYNGNTLESLRRDLNALNDRQIEKMISLLSSEVAQRIQRAFADKISIEERSNKYQVSAYELRYIESIAMK